MDAIKRHWWIFHSFILLTSAAFLLIVSVVGGMQLISDPSSAQQGSFDRVLSILYSIYFILLIFSSAVIFSAIRYRKTHSFRFISFATVGVVMLLVILFVLYKVEKDKYREIAKLEFNNLIIPDNPDNDYICLKEGGNLEFLRLDEAVGSINYIKVRGGGSFTSEILDKVSIDEKIFYSTGPLGADYKLQSYSDKYGYIAKCLNKKGGSILDKYKFQPPLYGVIYRSDDESLDAIYTLEFGNADNIVTLDTHYAQGGSSSLKSGVWSFDDGGSIIITFKTQEGEETAESLFLQLKNDALVAENIAPINKQVVFRKMR